MTDKYWSRSYKCKSRKYHRTLQQYDSSSNILKTRLLRRNNMRLDKDQSLYYVDYRIELLHIGFHNSIQRCRK